MSSQHMTIFSHHINYNRFTKANQDPAASSQSQLLLFIGKVYIEKSIYLCEVEKTRRTAAQKASLSPAFKIWEAQYFNVEYHTFLSLAPAWLLSSSSLHLSLSHVNKKDSKFWSLQILKDHGRLTNFAQIFCEGPTCAAVLSCIIDLISDFRETCNSFCGTLHTFLQGKKCPTFPLWYLFSARPFFPPVRRYPP